MAFVVEILQTIAVFLGGLFGRLGIFLLALALFVLPALVIALVARAVVARRRSALGLRSVAGVAFRPDVRYAPGHTWLLERPGGALEIGLDDLGQRLLTSVTAVELPRPGAKVRAGEPFVTLYGGGRPVRLAAPVSGTVAGVNAAVVRDPALVRRDGFGRGWLLALTPADEAWRALPMGEAAERWTASESARLAHFVEGRLGFAAADGGELVVPAPWLLGEAGYEAVLAAFLGA